MLTQLFDPEFQLLLVSVHWGSDNKPENNHSKKVQLFDKLTVKNAAPRHAYLLNTDIFLHPDIYANLDGERSMRNESNVPPHKGGRKSLKTVKKMPQADERPHFARVKVIQRAE